MPKKEIGPQTVSRVLRGADYFGSADQRFSQNLRNFREISARYPPGVCTYAGARGRAPSAVPTGYRRVPRHTCRLARGASSAPARPPAPLSQVSIGGRASERPPPRRLGARRRASPPGPPRVETAHSRIDTCPVGAACALARPRSGAPARQVWGGRGVVVRVGASLVLVL